MSGHTDGAETAYRREGAEALGKCLCIHLRDLRGGGERHIVVGQVKRKMNAARPGVIGLENQATRELALHAEVPFQGVWQRPSLAERRARRKWIRWPELR